MGREISRKIRRATPIAAATVTVGKAGGWATAPGASAQECASTIAGSGSVTQNGTILVDVSQLANSNSPACYAESFYFPYQYEATGKFYLMEGNPPYSPSDFSVVTKCDWGPGNSYCETPQVAIPNPNTKLLGYAAESNGAGLAALEMRPLESCGVGEGTPPCAQPAKGTYGGVNLNYKAGTWQPG